MSRAARTAISVIVLVVLAALAAAAVLLWHREQGKVDKADRREKALVDATTAAKADIPLFGNFSYSTLDADKKRATSVLTKAFATDFANKFAGLIATAQQRKATVTESVQDAQPVDATPDGNTVQVLVFFTQNATFGDGAPDKVQPLQYELTMQREGSTWLVGNLDVVQ